MKRVSAVTPILVFARGNVMSSKAKGKPLCVQSVYVVGKAELVTLLQALG